jgi:tryptophanase
VRTIIEPFRIRTVEPLRLTTRAEREQALRTAHYNLFSLRARDVLIDLLTDSGTGAMSTKQWAALMQGDESYAGSESYYELQGVVRELTGFEHVFPVHQGRAAERILCQIFGGKDKTIPNNTHFDTTRANIEFTGAAALDLPVREAHDPAVEDDFKGNYDLDRLARFLATAPRGTVPLGLATVTNNAVGGQPVSLPNLQAASALFRAHGIPFLLDAARFAENAWLVRQRDPAWRDAPLPRIVRAMFDCADGCMISAKKDGLVNIGGLLCVRDAALAEQIRSLLILGEGYPTYGGLAGRDLAALAQGLREVLDEDYLRYREASAAYLTRALARLGVPTVKPPALHAVYVDARAFLDHLAPEQLPGQSLCCELYLEGGIRAVEVGTLMFGRTDPRSGEQVTAPLELVRLALPRRVYTQSHFDWVIESFAQVARRKHELCGYRITKEGAWLRAFTAELEPMARAANPRSAGELAAAGGLDSGR